MRVMFKVSIPVEAGNKGIKDGTLPKTVMEFVEKFRPEASYFVATNGQRTAYFFVDMKDPSMIPSMAEPFMNNLNAGVEFQPAMNIEDMKTGIGKAMGH